MHPLIYGLLHFLAFFLIHVLVWRLTKLRKTPKNIVIIYCLTLLFSAVYLVYELRNSPTTSWSFEKNLQLIEYFHGILLSCSLFCAYLLTYPGIESDSPSCAILLTLEKSAASGISQDSLTRAISDQAMTLDRLQGLLRDKKIEYRNGRFSISINGQKFLNLFKKLRQIYGRGNFGG